MRGDPAAALAAAIAAGVERLLAMRRPGEAGAGFPARTHVDGADLWVAQQGPLGPYAEPSSLRDDVHHSLASLPGLAAVGNAAYLTMQASHAGVESRVMLVGFEPGRPGEPAFLVAGRPILRGHYEAIADEKAGFRVGDRVRIRRHEYEVVGLTRRMVSASGDPMLFPVPGA